MVDRPATQPQIAALYAWARGDEPDMPKPLQQLICESAFGQVPEQMTRAQAVQCLDAIRGSSRARLLEPATNWDLVSRRCSVCDDEAFGARLSVERYMRIHGERHTADCDPAATVLDDIDSARFGDELRRIGDTAEQRFTAPPAPGEAESAPPREPCDLDFRGE